MSFFEFRELEKAFSTNKLFSDISFIFPSTGFVSLLGSSGSGKTTLFYLLTGLEKRDKGNIFYQDKELVTETDFRNFRKECAFIFQEYGVLNYLTGFDNLNLGGYEIYEGLNILNKEHLKKKVATFSGGEKQRLTILKTISTNARIVFCDEPTGSLDENNGEIVMKELKKLAKTSLVIMVSHNIDLVYKYSDIILELKNQKLYLKKDKRCLYKTENRQEIKKTNFQKSILIAFKSFFQDKFKLIFSFIALMFSFASILLVYNLNISAKETIYNATQTYADFERLKVSEIENNKIEGTSFSLSKVKRPNLKEIKDKINNAEIEYNLDYFLLQAKITYKNEIVNINIYTFPFGSGLEDIRINNQAKSIFKNLEEKIQIEIKQDVLTRYKDKVYTDEVNLSLDCYIHYVYQEFNFLNAPCIFISHDALKNYMKSVQLNSLSLNRGIFTSLYDRYSAFSEDDEIYSSYSYYIDIKNKEDVYKTIESLKQIENISIESRAIQVYQSLNSSFNLVEMLMSLFAFIALILTVALLYLMMLSSFHKRKKEFAIYHTMGHSFMNFFINILLPVFSFLLITYFTSFLIYKIGGIYLNKLFFNFFECNIFSAKSFKFEIVFSHLIILFLISMFFASLFAFYAQRLKVSEVIKSE